jgi:uncharacterized protein
MRFAEDKVAGQNLIHAYAPGAITINDTVYSRSLIVTAEKIIDDWKPQSLDALKPDHFAVLTKLELEIVVLGTGATLRFPSPGITAPLIKSSIGLEVMDTAAACRTYDILLSENRRVAAALLMI